MTTDPAQDAALQAQSGGQGEPSAADGEPDLWKEEMNIVDQGIFWFVWR